MADLVCTTAMCSEGRASVQEMRKTFDTLATDENFPKAYFEPTVISLEQSFQANYSIFSEWIPFNPSCCAIKDIGAQADDLTTRMLAAAHAAGVTTGPGSTVPPITLPNVAVWVIAGLIVLMVVNKKVLA